MIDTHRAIPPKNTPRHKRIFTEVKNKNPPRQLPLTVADDGGAIAGVGAGTEAAEGAAANGESA